MLCEQAFPLFLELGNGVPANRVERGAEAGVAFGNVEFDNGGPLGELGCSLSRAARDAARKTSALSRLHRLHSLEIIFVNDVIPSSFVDIIRS
jgi:hypothetical protein